MIRGAKHATRNGGLGKNLVDDPPMDAPIAGCLCSLAVVGQISLEVRERGRCYTITRAIVFFGQISLGVRERGGCYTITRVIVFFGTTMNNPGTRVLDLIIIAILGYVPEYPQSAYTSKH